MGMFVILLGKYLRVEFLYSKVNIHLTYKSLLDYFQSGYTILYAHQHCMKIPVVLYLHHHLVMLSLNFLDILTDM